jgi:hypothetical protein
VVTAECWACDRGVPHRHRPTEDCPHTGSDGAARPCCANEVARRVELTTLAFNIRTGRAAVPDDPAELLGHDERT